MKKTLPLIFTIIVSIALLSGCQDRQTNKAATYENSAKESVPEKTLQKNVIGQPQSEGLLSVSAFYSPAQEMKAGEGSLQSEQDFTMYIGADITANKNRLGLEPGKTVPALTVEYSLLDEKNGKKEIRRGILYPVLTNTGLS